MKVGAPALLGEEEAGRSERGPPPYFWSPFTYPASALMSASESLSL